MAVINNDLNAPIPFQVPKGGTGNTTFTAYTVLCAGTTATNPFQSIAGVGIAGQVLTSNGPAALPTFQNVAGTGTVNSGNINEIAYYAANGNAVSGLTTVARSVLTSNSTGVLSWIALTDGQVVVGSTAGSPAAASLTAGTGITITPGSNSITIAATAVSGITWNDVIGTTQTLAANNGYNCTNVGLTTCALPATAAKFSYIHVIATTAAGWKITQSAGQQIQFGNLATTLGAGGSLQSTAIGDSVLLLTTTANTTWFVLSATGNITIV